MTLARTQADIYRESREEMVIHQLANRGIRDAAILEAFRAVPREEFVPASLMGFAYDDTPLPIEAEQTISQPYIVAVMAEALGKGDRLLEIGAGSGYAAAILSRIAGAVFTVERDEALARAARGRLEKLGYTNVVVLHADGTLGWPENAPYDAIVVAAGGPSVPRSLLSQLAIGGRLVMPVGSTRRDQTLVRITRTAQDGFRTEELGPVRFVPLIGAEGWQEAPLPAARGPSPP